jgi:hypothetical protein
LVLDELILAGELQEPSSKSVLKAIAGADDAERKEVLDAVMKYVFVLFIHFF